MMKSTFSRRKKGNEGKEEEKKQGEAMMIDNTSNKEVKQV